MADQKGVPMAVVSGTVVGVTDASSSDAVVVPIQPNMQVAQPMPGQPMMQVAQPMMQVAQPMMQMQPPANPFSTHPTAIGNVGALPPSPMVLGPPHPVKKAGVGMEAIRPGYHTGSPRVSYQFIAPTMDGCLTEADFDRAVALIEAEQGDPLAAFLQGGSALVQLELDVEGRLDDLRKVIKNNCYCFACMVGSVVCTCCALCAMCNEQIQMSCDGNTDQIPKLQESASAHHMTLTDTAVVYSRDAHRATTIKNFTAFDQYGHKYPGAGATESQIAAATVHVPLQHADLELAPLTDVQAMPMLAWKPANDSCDNKPASQVLVLRAGEGVRLVVGCVEVGPNSNVQQFLEQFQRAKQSAPPMTAELAAAYNSWFGQRLARAGTMAGAAPRRNQVMDRGGVGGTAGSTMQPYVRAVGPLPQHLGIVKSNMQPNRMLHWSISKDTAVHTIHNGTFVHQLNAEDRVVSINGVQVPGQATQQFLDQAQASSPQGGGGFMQVRTYMPHFQPTHMLTVGPMPAGSTGGIQFDANRTPPTILEPDEAAAKSGLLKGDIVMQAIVDGVTHNTNGMTGQDFINMTHAAQGTTITVLQTHRMTSGPPTSAACRMLELPWVHVGEMKP